MAIRVLLDHDVPEVSNGSIFDIQNLMLLFALGKHHLHSLPRGSSGSQCDRKSLSQG